MAILSLSPKATPQWREALASPAVRRTSPLMFIIVFLKEAALYFVTLFASFSGRRRLLSLSGKRDSNPRPSAWEANALPTELLPHCVFHDFDCKFMHCFFPSNIPLHFFFRLAPIDIPKKRYNFATQFRKGGLSSDLHFFLPT